MNPQIIHEDEDFIVLDKPSGITVNKSVTTKGNTIQDWAEKRLGIKNYESRIKNENEERITNNQLTIEEEFVSRGGVVHRLDKETSGILLVAKNSDAFENLKNQFKERKVEKTYIALAHGEVKPAEGEINAPLGRLPHNRMRFGVIADGRDASTFYKVLKLYKLGEEKLSYLELKPKTGRTHQIRVHLKHLNHPIFADELYAGRKTARNDRKHLNRLFLHAAGISINHPTTSKRSIFESKLPNDLTKFLSGLDLLE